MRIFFPHFFIVYFLVVVFLNHLLLLKNHFNTIHSIKVTIFYVFFLATEFVGPKYRVLTSATCSSMFAVGQVILGGVAWLIEPWRYMILALHIPCFLIIAYYWILSESVRWLLSQKKYDRAKSVLQRVAKRNRTTISEKSMEALCNPPEPVKVSIERRALRYFFCNKFIFNSRVLYKMFALLFIYRWWTTPMCPTFSPPSPAPACCCGASALLPSGGSPPPSCTTGCPSMPPVCLTPCT